MKIAVVLPRGMVFSETGATSIDLVVRDQIQNSQYNQTSYVVGVDVTEPFEGIDYRPILPLGQRQLNKAYLEQIKKDVPDVVVVHQYPQTAAYLAQHLHKVPVILYRHGLLKKRAGWASKLIKQFQFRKLARIIFVSDFIRDAFLEDFPSCKARCTTINNAVDTNYWAPSVEKKKSICFAGRARQDKGILELILAYQSLPESEWELDLVLAVQTDAERAFFGYVEHQLKDAKNINLRKNLRSNEVREVFASAQIAALPSIVKEGFPRAVVEAMSSGCATITTRSGGTPEAVGSAGILLEKTTPEVISKALLGLISHPDEIVQWGRRARLHAINHLDLKVKAVEYDAVLSSYLNAALL
ncbi:Spore coat protein SA [Pseudovibrio sp. W64]|uniref:glycosyltransferase family 4 protein n=1 Tax=Pseudovibrio sp. W64 TaxID=1735583 RepID=UPI0007AE41A2|nr:glycosyltransferase family 4 protein [Pseudovibrio sp. W64]KZK87651.1 Spore coat protein SA [Pseudovibrio sp. W64]